MYVAEDLGAVAQLLYDKALANYRQLYAPHLSFELLRTTGLERVEVELNVLGPRVMHVTAHVVGRMAHRTHSEFSRWHKSGETEWTFAGGTLDL